MWVQPYLLTSIIDHASCAEIMTHRAPQAARDIRRGLLPLARPARATAGGRGVGAQEGPALTGLQLREDPDARAKAFSGP